MSTTASKIHHGRNIKRLREMLGIKQEVIAIDLDISQQAVSDLEQKEVLDEKLLKKIAKILHVPTEAIKNMNDEIAHNYINTFYDSSTGYNGTNNHYTFNPVEKVIELYERILKEKDEKIALLEKLLK